MNRKTEKDGQKKSCWSTIHKWYNNLSHWTQSFVFFVCALSIIVFAFSTIGVLWYRTYVPTFHWIMFTLSVFYTIIWISGCAATMTMWDISDSDDDI